MESSEPTVELSLLQRIRNCWEFSNLMQFVFIFGRAVKIDEDFSIDVCLPTSNPNISLARLWSQPDVPQIYINTSIYLQDMEIECLKPGPSEKLVEIGLALLKCVSSHRGLT